MKRIYLHFIIDGDELCRFLHWCNRSLYINIGSVETVRDIWECGIFFYRTNVKLRLIRDLHYFNDRFQGYLLFLSSRKLMLMHRYKVCRKVQREKLYKFKNLPQGKTSISTFRACCFRFFCFSTTTSLYKRKILKYEQ